MEKTEKLADKLDSYNDKIYERKRKKLREKLNVGERVYLLAERIKKKKHTCFKRILNNPTIKQLGKAALKKTINYAPQLYNLGTSKIKNKTATILLYNHTLL